MNSYVGMTMVKKNRDKMIINSSILPGSLTCSQPGAHERKERPTTRNGVWTMKHLTLELVFTL